MPYRQAPAHVLRVAARSVPLAGRTWGEDAFALFPLDRSGALAGGSARHDFPAVAGAWRATPGVGVVVLDGMGGFKSGDVACKLAIDALSGRFLEPVPAGLDARSEWLAEALRLASNHVHRGRPGRDWGAATAVLALMTGEELHVVHAGDVRAYRLREGRLEQLTRDHTLIDDALDHGVSAEQIAEFPPGVITRALGMMDRLLPAVAVTDLHPGDALLIATDGLHTVVESTALLGALRDVDDPAEACAALVAMAERAGGRDDITALVARVERL